MIDTGLSDAERRIAAGEGRPLFEISRTGPAGSAHCHALRVMSIPYPEGDEVWLEVSEPGGCGCVRRLTLAQAAHVLINSDMPELLGIEAREVCPSGHPHHGPAMGPYWHPRDES